jgi:hypothetical protein
MNTTTPDVGAAQAAASNKPPRQLQPQPVDPTLRKRQIARAINSIVKTLRREIAELVAELREIADPLGDDVPRTTCMVCGVPFEGRDDARFCSGRCRIRNWRAQQ